MKFTSFIFAFFTFFSLGNAQASHIIISPLGHQEVYEGARITTYFSTLKYFDDISFSSSDMPSFGTLLNDGKGDGRFIFDPTENDIGEYTISLHAESGALSADVTFRLSVKALPSDAVIYYLDPVNGSPDNPGTATEPFSTLTDVLTYQPALLSGNTYLYLRSGYHGSPVFSGSYDAPVHVLAERNNNPTVKKLNFFLTNNWYVSGLDISPENNNETANTTLVNISSGTKKIVLTNCKIYSIEDASVWATNEDWYAGCGDGIISSGKECLYINNYLKNTWFSVELRKKDCEFSYNIIDWFGADAIRALDNNQRIRYNQIKNATVFDYDHPTRPQHDDGIQSWTFNAPVKDMIIEGNQIVDIADPNLPLPTEIMQGIVDFDGFAENWVIQNNIVITHHAHGIALYGAKNCKIVNNTVLRNPFNLFSSSFKPWIRINPRKEDVGGDLSTGNLVRNNIASSFKDEDKEPATLDHNTFTNTYSNIFIDYLGWDFYLSDSSLAAEAGNPEDAPSIDLNRKRRNVGIIDNGCFERNASLIDNMPPSIPEDVNATQISKTAITLTWTESVDNTGIAYYEVRTPTQALCTESPSVNISGLDPATEYDISVVAVDYFGNKSGAALYSVATDPLEMLSIYYIPADRHDQLIKSNHKLMWVGMPYLYVGGYFGEQDASSVLPFHLPCLGTNRTVVSANLLVTLDEVVNTPSANVDLYGVAYYYTACASASYHWQGFFGGDADATPIAGGYITPESMPGPIELSASQQENLGAYIQSHFDEEACGDFIFLRLNINQENSVDNTYYKIISADNKNSFQTPLLSILTSGPVATKVVEIKNGLHIFPNPSSGESVNLQLEGFDRSTLRLLIHDAGGRKVFQKEIIGNPGKFSLSIHPNLRPGVYYVAVLSHQKYALATLVVQ